MLRRLAALTAAMLLWVTGARAEPTAASEPVSAAPSAATKASTAPVPSKSSSTSFSDRFFRGTTPGELPTEKIALVATLYVGAATSVGVGIAALVSAGSKHNDAESFKHSAPQNFCDDLASSTCATYRRLLDVELSRRETGMALLGVGGLLALGGALTAELWHNDQAPELAVQVNATGLSLGLHGRF
jgi:hypothetical protein